MNAKKLFLIDSLGAAMTAAFLVFVLARFEGFFGMPSNILYILAAAAGCYAIYSATCYRFLTNGFKPFLRVIATANLCYCIATAVLVIYFHSALSVWTLAYFTIEIAIIVILASVEWRSASQPGFKSNQTL